MAMLKTLFDVPSRNCLCSSQFAVGCGLVLVVYMWQSNFVNLLIFVNKKLFLLVLENRYESVSSCSYGGVRVFLLGCCTVFW